MIQDEAAEAEAIADLVNSLSVHHADPERFHIIKSEVSARLRQMAKRLRGDGARNRTARPTLKASREAMARTVFLATRRPG